MQVLGSDYMSVLEFFKIILGLDGFFYFYQIYAGRKHTHNDFVVVQFWWHCTLARELVCKIFISHILPLWLMSLRNLLPNAHRFKYVFP